MKPKKYEIKQGVTLHTIKTNKFKTDLTAVFITVPITRKNVTINCLIPAVLRRGSRNLNTQQKINKTLEEMYGATFDCGIEKTGDNHIIKFYIESINNKFLPNNEKNISSALYTLFEIIFNPLLENGVFKKEYVESEKKNIEQLIRSKIDNKEQYALDRTVEEMYKNMPYGLYKYGYIEDLPNINNKLAHERYEEIIKLAKIDIYVSGDIEEENIKEIVLNNPNIKNLKDRQGEFIVNNEQTEIKEQPKISKITDTLDVNQGKLILGLDILENSKNSRFAVGLYNVILGESATSKLFQNVREKASLAYSARSTYIRQKNNIFIKCGIEITNYDKALKIIEQQLQDMKNGEFTEEDIINAKKYMLNGINSIEEIQDTEITYYFGQELSNSYVLPQEYKEKINSITKQQIVDAAQKIYINTIYFLKNK